MIYPIVPVVLIALFVLYVLYLLVLKKDVKKFKTVLFPGLVFIVIWVVIYYFLLK